MSNDFVPALKPIADVGSACPAGGNSSELPFAGFWARAMALAVDVALLTTIFYFAANYSYEALYPARHATQPLAVIFVFLYFWIANGPPAQGQTVGKKLAGLRTMRRDGANLTWGQAALRALFVQIMLFAYVSVLAPFFLPGMILQRPPSLQGLLAFGTLSYLALGYLFSNAVFCGLHPWKASFHDLAVKTIVVRAGREKDAVALAAEWDEVCQARLRLAKWPAGTMALIFLVIVFQFWRAYLPEVGKDSRVRARIHQKLKTDGFEFLSYDCPSGGKAKDADERLARIREMIVRERRAPLTTETLQLWSDGRKVHFAFFCDEPATSKTLLADPRYGDLMKQLPPLAEELAKDCFPEAGNAPTSYTHVQAEFYECLPLYLYARGRVAWRDRIPHLENDAATTQTVPAKR